MSGWHIVMVAALAAARGDTAPDRGRSSESSDDPLREGANQRGERKSAAAAEDGVWQAPVHGEGRGSRALEALDAARLREALEEAVAWYEARWHNYATSWLEKARAALAASEPDKTGPAEKGTGPPGAVEQPLIPASHAPAPGGASIPRVCDEDGV